MPRGAPRTGSAKSSLYTGDEITDSSGKTRIVPSSQTRNIVGDQGAEKIAESRKSKTGNKVVARASDDQETPKQAKARKKKAMDDSDQELYNKVKNAMTKRGGATSRSNYED